MHRSTPCAAAAAETEDELQAAGVDVSLLWAIALGVLTVVVARIGRDRLRSVFVRFARAIDRQYIQPLNAPGPDVVVDPLVSRGLTTAAKSLADTLYNRARK